jgi:hypothetical protein
MGQAEVKTKTKVKKEAKTESRLFSQPSFLIFAAFYCGIFFAVNYSRIFRQLVIIALGGARLPWSPPENRGYPH